MTDCRQCQRTVNWRDIARGFCRHCGCWIAPVSFVDENTDGSTHPRTEPT